MSDTTNRRGVLITGASQGLGRALARCLGRDGARVALVARRQDVLEEAVASLRAEGIDAYAVAGDVGDKDAIVGIAARAAALVGPIEVLVHSASTLGPTPLRALLDTECEDLERVLAVNLVGPFRLTKIVAGAMAIAGRGVVVSVSSDASVEAYPSWGAYGVSKAALDHLSRIWAAELEGRGVRFVAVDPGEMDTAMHAAALPDADPATLARPSDVAERIAALIDAAPTGARLEASRFEEVAR